MIKYLAQNQYKQRKVFSMVKSIKHFAEESIKNFEKLEDDFFKNPEQIAEYVLGITKELHTVGLLMIKESLETMKNYESDVKGKWKKAGFLGNRKR